MVMGRNGYGPKWSWAEMIMGRNDPESSVSNFNFTESLVISLTGFVGSFKTQCIYPGEYSFSFVNFNVLYNSQLVTILFFQY